ncbi:MAG: caspase family protein, partial [Pyrinomonadaceae bacterium]|nr:caspase family protein [Phycisphaerales bacterium]
MRKALIVGINYYQHNSQLFGCVKDAEAVQGALEWHGDKRKNFDVKVLMGEGRGDNVSRDELYSAITDVFAGDSDVALFYFAGHGHIAPTGGYLLSSECRSGHDGISLADVVALANASTARNRIIVLDSCHSGIAAASPRGLAATEINEGVTVLTASSANQYATEENNRGVFTTIFVDALNGAAA